VRLPLDFGLDRLPGFRRESRIDGLEGPLLVLDLVHHAFSIALCGQPRQYTASVRESERTNIDLVLPTRVCLAESRPEIRRLVSCFLNVSEVFRLAVFGGGVVEGGTEGVEEEGGLLGGGGGAGEREGE
jgi:hypothetical protein